MLTKCCKDCGCHLPLTEFPADKKAKPTGKSLGVASVCKFCKALRRKAWKLANPGRTREHRRIRKRKLRAKRREELGPYVLPVALRESDPAAWRAKKRWHKRAYEAKLAQAKPAWADQSDIAGWYRLAEVLSRGGVRFEVDHVVPLRGKTVSGFHSQHNLQVLPAYLNASKGNRHWPDMP